MPDIFITRQPIYNRTQHVIGYEVIYQADGDIDSCSDEGDVVASQAILNAFTEVGLDSLVGKRTAFVNISRGFICGNYPLPLPCNRVVVEVAGKYEIDDELIASLRRMSNQGYVIALDDFVFKEAARPLLEFVDIVKLDVQKLSEHELHNHFSKLGKYPNLKLQVSNVETQEDYEACHKLGADYFQGFFFCRPKLVKRRRLSSNIQTLMQLLSELQQPNVSIARLEFLISRDVGLSYKLLRYLNSAFFSLHWPVESIQRAIVFLGTKVIQRWATLMILSRIDDKPSELMVTAVVRAKMCELLAQAMDYEAGDTCFTVGLLSVLDALLDMPMRKVVALLSLSTDINKALLSYKGVPGEILATVLHYEFNEWDQIKNPDLDKMVVKDAYLQSIAWADDACRSLVGNG